jgi:hypothetical protein
MNINERIRYKPVLCVDKMKSKQVQNLILTSTQPANDYTVFLLCQNPHGPCFLKDN